jgi:CubicO group peptidase (beta-lactamase class C family)
LRLRNVYLSGAAVLLMTAFLFVFPLQGDTSIDEPVEKIMKEGNMPGTSIVLIKGNQQVVIKSYGFADLENREPVTPETLFEIGSCSKSFTALAMLQLARDGMVKLDDPVSKYFPAFKGKYNGKEYDISINQLLHHVSGIRPGTFGKIPLGSSETPISTLPVPSSKRRRV